MRAKMDLRGILNTSENGEQQQPAAAAASTPKQPPPPHTHHYRQSQSPSTPSQGKPPYSYDFASHPSQGSPGKPAPLEFPRPPSQPQRQQSAPYAGQSPYQQPAQYPRPAPPPPLQPPGYDVRTPGGGSVAMAAPSPYRTPSGAGPTSAGYFPVQQPNEMTSPVQQHTAQFAAQGPYQGRDGSYSSQPGPVGQPGQPSQPGQPVVGVTIPVAPGPGSGSGPSPYMQQSPLPQTPPIGTPGAAGGAHHYLHQRSQSAHSNNTPTPTSAHSSQHQQYPPPPQTFSQQHQQLQQQQQQQQQQQLLHSPVATSHAPPPFARQHSQPPTSVGPPGPPTRHSSEAPPNFTQPPSPYAQRLPSVGPVFPQQMQASPPQPPPPTLNLMRMPQATESSRPDSRATETQRSSLTHSERNRTPSISPKTRISSLPGMSGQPIPPRDRDVDPRIDPRLASSTIATAHMPSPHTSTSHGPHFDSPHAVHAPHAAGPPLDQAITPAKKRKMEDRDTEDETDRRDVRQRQSVGVNGIRVTPSRSNQASASTSPQALRRKPRRYAEVPIWAQPCQGRKLQHANYELVKKHIAAATTTVNGRHESVRTDKSRQTSPEAARAQPQPQVPPLPDPNAEITALLGPWEPTITNTKPFDDISRSVADFLFLNVVMNPDSAEIAARGIEFEIEAKLGTLIDRDTNERVDRGVDTECLLQDNGRLSFRSSMTEVHHKWFNEFLNEVVVRTDPRHAENTGPHKRVPVQYKHRRELDKYFELPAALQDRLPGCVLSRLRHVPKARVTYDQRTREVLAKIVKVRVADLSLHLPHLPLDCRISINLEMNWDGSVEELEQLPGSQDKMAGRNKDRLSYAQGNVQIDLTQVTMAVPTHQGQRLEREHELEVELAAEQLIDQGRRLANQPEPLPNKYPELVESFVDNIRLLARKAAERERQTR